MHKQKLHHTSDQLLSVRPVPRVAVLTRDKLLLLFIPGSSSPPSALPGEGKGKGKGGKEKGARGEAGARGAELKLRLKPELKLKLEPELKLEPKLKLELELEPE